MDNNQNQDINNEIQNDISGIINNQEQEKNNTEIIDLNFINNDNKMQEISDTAQNLTNLDYNVQNTNITSNTEVSSQSVNNQIQEENSTQKTIMEEQNVIQPISNIVSDQTNISSKIITNNKKKNYIIIGVVVIAVFALILFFYLFFSRKDNKPALDNEIKNNGNSKLEKGLAKNVEIKIVKEIINVDGKKQILYSINNANDKMLSSLSADIRKNNGESKNNEIILHCIDKNSTVYKLLEYNENDTISVENIKVGIFKNDSCVEYKNKYTPNIKMNTNNQLDLFIQNNIGDDVDINGYIVFKKSDVIVGFDSIISKGIRNGVTRVNNISIPDTKDENNNVVKVDYDGYDFYLSEVKKGIVE